VRERLTVTPLLVSGRTLADTGYPGWWLLCADTDQANDPATAYGELDPAIHYYGDSLPGMRSLNTHPGGSSGHLATSWIAWLQELGYSLPAEMVSGLGPGQPYGTGSYAAVGQQGAVRGGEPDPERTLGHGGFQHATDADGTPVAAFYNKEHSDTAFAVNQALR
jgi:hypothetical protein